MWDEITFPFPNFNGTPVEVWKWISNVVTHFSGYVITYTNWDQSYSILVKDASGFYWKWQMIITKNETLYSKFRAKFLNIC